MLIVIFELSLTMYITEQDYFVCIYLKDHLCGVVVRVTGYRSRGPGLIPGATRFSEKLWVWNGVHSAL
jgi:hypothetical protein